jgi:uncharacterized protein (DUF1330 family)
MASGESMRRVVGPWRRRVALTALISLGITSAQAQPAPEPAAVAPGYLVVIGRALDRSKLGTYSAALPPIYAQTGGRYIGLGRAGAGATCLYGLCDGRSAVVATWADHSGLERFWWGEAYRQAARLRDNAGAFTVVGLKGSAGAQAFESGALLLATFSGGGLVPGAAAWASAAARAGACLLAPIEAAAMKPLEGDALYSSLALLSFQSKAQRDDFVAGSAQRALLQDAASNALMFMLSVDAPVAR